MHLEATVRVLQRRPTNRVDAWEDDRYLRVLSTAGGDVLVEVENRGTIDAPALCWRIRSGGPLAAAQDTIERTLRRMLGLDVDPTPLQAAAGAVPAFRPVSLALRGMRPPRFASLFETIINVVPFQQLSLDAGAAILGRLVERYGPRLEHGGRSYFGFPAARTIARARVDGLRACGLSAAKAEALRSLAHMIDAGDLKEEDFEPMSTARAQRRLIELPGVGPWSAAILVLRGLGRLDVFPPGDAGALRGLGALLKTRPSTSLERTIERFGERRGYLYFCLLGGSLLTKGLIHAAPRPASRRDAGQRTGA